MAGENSLLFGWLATMTCRIGVAATAWWVLVAATGREFGRWIRAMDAE
jgi:hypothetical protein